MAVGSEEVFIILLIVILIISVVLGVFPVFTKVAKNKCILQQHTLLNAFDRMIELVNERGAPVKNHSFMVMGCTECMWYDSLNSKWMITHSKEEPINKSISYQVLGVAANCMSCDEKIDNVNCANMMKDTIYNFEIGTDYVRCTNCPASPNLCENQIFFGSRVDVVNDPKNEESISLVSYRNTLYLFYHKMNENNIYYRTSIDGKNWNPEILLTDNLHNYGFPSAGVFNDQLYVAYSGDVGCFGLGCSGWEIYIQKFDGTDWTNAIRLTNNNELDGGSYFGVYKNRFYIFYHHGRYNLLKDITESNIRYRICNSNCDVIANWGSEIEATSLEGQHVYPSVIGDDKIHLSYSANIGTTTDNWEIYYKTCDDTNANSICENNEWSSFQRVTDNPKIDGHSHLIFYKNKIYVFYHEASGMDYSKISYKSYDGEWKNECGAAGGNKPDFAAFPAVSINSGKIILCYTKYDGTNWKIVCQ